MGNDGTLKKRTNLIESEDEPWHATSRPAQILDLPDFDQGLKNSIGFMEAEEALTIANSAAKNAEEVTKALEQAKKDGAREGSPALLAADKLLKRQRILRPLRKKKKRWKHLLGLTMKTRPK